MVFRSRPKQDYACGDRPNVIRRPARALLAAAVNVGAPKQSPARRKLRVVAGGSHDRVYRADDDAGLSVELLHEVIAAQCDDVSVVAGQGGELGLHRVPQPFLRVKQSRRRAGACDLGQVASCRRVVARARTASTTADRNRGH
jgi:hypothetical protein